MLDADADRDSADVRCEDRRQNYRLGDLLSHKFFQMEQRPEDRMHFYCDHCNRSLGCELARARSRTRCTRNRRRTDASSATRCRRLRPCSVYRAPASNLS